jgi:hypothetical protein
MKLISPFWIGTKSLSRNCEAPAEKRSI